MIEVPGVVAVSFSPAHVQVARLAVVYEATKAETAINQKGNFPSDGTCRCRCRRRNSSGRH